MDQSCVGDLCSRKDIKRRRKINYRKSKGRLIVKTSGILNKSLLKKSFSKSLNESIGNHGKLVSIQNINSFLAKNRELAKALEECRQQTKNLENQKFTYQLECIEMREKLSIYKNAILKCTCQENQPDGKTKILFQLKDNISQSAKYLNDYLSALITQKTDIVPDENDKDTGDTIDPVDEKIREKPGKLFSSKGSQASFDGNGNKTSTTTIATTTKSTRNKKLQVSLIKPCTCQQLPYNGVNVFTEKYNTTKDSGSSSRSTHNNTDKVTAPALSLNVEKKSKAIQCTFNEPVKVRSFATQCDVIVEKQSTPRTGSKMGEPQRRPLFILKTANTGSNSTCTEEQRRNNTNTSKKSDGITGEIRSCLSKLHKFKIYEDENNKENIAHVNSKAKHQRKVTIASPVKVCYYEAMSAGTPVEERLRQRVHKSYKEPCLNTKLTIADPSVDDRFYTSSHPKVKRSRKIKKQFKKKKPTIAIEDIISLVEESFIAGAASVSNN